MLQFFSVVLMNSEVPFHVCLGTIRYEDDKMGIIWKPTDSGNVYYLVHQLFSKMDIFDGALEARQTEYFGSDISHTPQLVLDSRQPMYLPPVTALFPIYVVHLHAFIN
jgi:hypothetical protein